MASEENPTPVFLTTFAYALRALGWRRSSLSPGLPKVTCTPSTPISRANSNDFVLCPAPVCQSQIPKRSLGWLDSVSMAQQPNGASAAAAAP